MQSQGCPIQKIHIVLQSPQLNIQLDIQIKQEVVITQQNITKP